MHCSRCYSLMAKDHLLVFENATRRMLMDGYRCMNCGHVLDAVIEQHRPALQEKVLVFPSGEPDYQDDEVHLGAESFIRRAA